eukprot:CAMPEP_0198145582 /NCGR_PEP_ID=MMETSP1443-20131203/24435_1 /TAXON_ID=186043 /ORGANISM="Entomoneis sp., Strain CCMP2396" /LENGTH=381 /DNA_ID=CAMNT_0043809271 /DNA_START=8 /DNA_END=1153 /DNA_ORIENTATION=-
MTFLRSLAKIIFARILPVIVLLVSVLVGWLQTQRIPMGTLFVLVIPALKGYWPPVLVGHGNMVGTPPVPEDMKPAPRPENELFQVLSGGYKIPQQGIGMCCRPTAYDDVLVERTILWYLLSGGRHIDTADVYLNHRAIGKGIKEAMQRGVPREEIFVTTKLWPSDFGPTRAKEVAPVWLEELGLEYIDLVLMHSPEPLIPIGMPEGCHKLPKQICRQQTWKALSDVRELGLVRNVGVSNFAVHHLKNIIQMEDVAPIAINQIQYNPWISQDWADAASFCHENNITITGYNSLGGSFQHHKAQTIEIISAIANKYEKSVAQIMLRWTLQKNVVVIPGTGNPNYMKENLSIYGFELSSEDMDAIDGLRENEEMKEFMTIPARE